MTDFEDRFRGFLRDLTDRAPTAPPDRGAVLHRRIARRRRIRVAGTTGAAVVALAGVSAGLVTLRPVAHHAPRIAGTSATAAPSHAALDGAKNILLAGEGPDGTNDRGSADSIIILHLAADHRSAYLVPIPRDAYARIPAYDNGASRYPGGQDKIGAAYRYGARGLSGTAARQHGLDLLARTVTELSGITVDAASFTDPLALQQIVNAVGGVDMYVDERTVSADIGYDAAGRQVAPLKTSAGGAVDPVPGVRALIYEVGNHHFNGIQAMDYVRQRVLLANGDGDYGRQRHQEQLLVALYRKVAGSGILTNPQRLAGLLTTVSKTVTFEGGGASLTDWLFSVRGLSTDSLVGIAMNRGQYHPLEVPGVGYVEQLDGTSQQLLGAVRDDSVGQFVTAHPDWVVSTR
ncbi:LCP family protein [Rugosimonospora africana]|uniref:Cell envelope-related transcriptional attenuator domain-containing protein n=1 Tax=Rugosimonospora africana TaxID=556532 RepID=A0A8J3QSQ6_9ACTN|nr:LCP family protein [Rugosimonospora africana]GIH15779.1 hypothetical protein Raf01_39510 [Rugosimonospora africana]